ncbi:MAG: hypothetical protein HY781_12880 [Chloroflexi bacterium]|nr:hypothetical protein [Chloroflexota bacterium]
MQQQTISATQDVKVTVNPVPGDLRVAGWERAEIMVKTDGDELNLTSNNGEASVSCDEDLILYVPRQAVLEIQGISGDASFQALHGPLRIGPVAGDLTMHDVGPVNLDTVSGDASLRTVGAVTAKSISGDFTLRVGNGPCAIETIGGDASIRDVNGEVAVQSVGSDLYLRNVRGSVNVNAGADVALYVEPLPDHTYTATAGDDIIVRLPPKVNVELHLVSGDAENIQVDIPGVEFPGDSATYDITVGEAADNIAKMYLTSGDDLLVTCQAGAWESAADFGVDMADSSSWAIPPIPPLPPDFSERINRRVQAAMERPQVHIEEAGRRAKAAGRRTGIKVEAAVRRAEAKARAAEVRARRSGINVTMDRWHWDLTPHGPVETGQAISDEERLTILRMLQEKKISMEDAEKLLAALEGK